MAVTLEGTFRIIDRASPALRSIERQALKTDAAIASVGASLDAVGSDRQLRKLDRVNRNVRTLGSTTQMTGRQTRGASAEFGRMDSKIDKVGRTIERTGLKFKAFGALMKPVMFLGIATAIGTLVQAVGALAGGVTSLVPGMVDLTGLAAPAVAGITGIAVSAISAKLALSGLSKAYAGNKAALKQLTPEGRVLLAQLKQMKPVVKELRQASQQGLFPGLEKALARLKVAAPALQQILRRGGAALGGGVARIATHLTQPGALGDLNTISAQGATMLGRLVTTFISFTDVLRNFAVAARPFTDWLTKSIALWAQHRARVSQFNRDSGKTAAFLDRTKVAVERAAKTLRLLWGNLRLIGQAARPLGDELYGSMNRALERWQKFHETVAGRTGLTREFLAMGSAVKGIMRLVNSLGAAIFRMGTSPGLPKTLESLNRLVPSLEKTLNFLADTFGPPLANMLASIGNLATSLSGAAGPFTLMADLLAKTLNFISGITQAVPGLGKVFGTALDVLLIQRFLVKLGLLQKGWLGVAGAARTAAVAEAGAMGGGMLGGRLGRLGGRAGGAASALGFGFASGRRGGRLAGDFGPLAKAGNFLGTGRLGSVLAGAGRFAGPVGIAGLAAGIGTQFLPVSDNTKSIGTDVAMGAGLGSFFGPVGMGVGALGGLALGLSRGGGGDIRAGIAGHMIEQQMGGLGPFPSQLAKLTAQLAIYQSAQRELQGDQSKQAQMELQSIQQEITARRSVIAQIKAERQQRLDASRASQAKNVSTDLGHLFDLLTGRGGKTRAAALSRVNAVGNQDLRRMKGVARLDLAEGLLAWEAKVARHDPAARRVAARERAFIGDLVPGALPIASKQRRLTGSMAEFGALAKQFRLQHRTEVEREALHGPFTVVGGKPSGTKLQDAAYRWLVANLGDKRWAAALVEAVSGTGTMPRTPQMNNSAAASAAVKQVGGAQFDKAVHAAFQSKNLDPKTKSVFAALEKMLSGHARGGRVRGMGGGLSDSVPIGGGAIAAGGEMVLNRHHEAMIDRGLGGRGSVASVVAGMPVKHSQFMARRFAKGGRMDANLGGHPGNITPGLSSLIAAVENRWPNLYVGATTDGNHVTDSYHWKGMAVDFDAGPPGSPDYAYLDKAAAWINSRYGGQLTEGIHNPDLSVKFGKPVPDSYWGSDIWAGHLNHIHLALAGAFQGAAGGAAAPSRSVLSGRTGAAGGGAAALTALAFAGSPGATGPAARAALARAAIMGFVPVGGGGGGGSGAGRAVGKGSAAAKRSLSGAMGMTASRGSMAANKDNFAAALAAATGLAPSVTRAWVAQEGGYQPGGTGGWNYLNVSPSSSGGSYSGVPVVGHSAGNSQVPGGFQQFGSERAALKETAYWINHMSNYAALRASIPQGPEAQIAAIIASGWGTKGLHLAQGGRVKYAGAFERGGTFRTNGPTAFVAGDGASPHETVSVSRGHGGGASLTIQSLEINVGGAEGQTVKEQVVEALEETFEVFARELEREATK